MTGAFLNAIGILLGGFWGLAVRKPPSLRAQLIFRSALGLSAIFFGLRLVWLSLGGTFLSVLGQILVALLAVTGGFLDWQTVVPAKMVESPWPARGQCDCPGADQTRRARPATALPPAPCFFAPRHSAGSAR